MTEREGDKIDSRLDDMEKVHYARGCHQRREWDDWTRGLSNKLEESKALFWFFIHFYNRLIEFNFLIRN